MKKKNKAFTLAETLIALAIIGVVAVLTIPLIISAVNERSWTAAKDTFKAKIEEAAKQMNVAGELSGYTTNETFANTFQRYMKVAKRCTSTNLSDCFGSVFRDSGGEEVNTSDLKTGENLGHETYTSNLVGLSIIDGTNVILAFNPDCPQLDWVNTSSGSTTSCLSMLYDINGRKSPNQIGKDIGALNATVSLTGTDCIQIGSYCIAPGIVTYLPINTIANPQFDPDYAYSTNYWAGAKKACSDLGMNLPSSSALVSMGTAYLSDTPSGAKQKIDEAGMGTTSWYWTSESGGPMAVRASFPGGNQPQPVTKTINNSKVTCIK